MFCMRLLSRKDDSRKSAGEGLRFDGIRTQEKLRWFLMTDIMSYYVYKQLSENYYANRSGEDEKKHLAEIVKISKSVSLMYAGNPSGTPADQIAKRAENVISAVRSENQKHRDPAVTVAESNVAFYRGIFARDADGEQMAVRISMPNSDLCGTIRERFGYQGGVPGYVSAGDFISWFVSDILEAARSDDSIQSVMKIQYDTMNTMFPERTDLPEAIRLSIVRIYLAVCCILHEDVDSIGDVCEPVVKYGSFRCILPSFRVPERTDNLVIVTSAGYGNLSGKDYFGDLFKNIAVCDSPVDAWDQELMLYKTRLLMGFRPYNLLVYDDGNDPEWSGSLMVSLQRMRWNPVHIVMVSDSGSATKIPFDHSVLDARGRTRDDIAADVRGVYMNGIHAGDRYAEAIMRTTYRDLLLSAYPGIDSVFEKNPRRCDSILLLNDITQYVSVNMPSRDCKHTELVHAVAEIIGVTNLL